MFISLTTDILEEPKTTADIAMPTAPTFATLATPTSTSPTDLGTFFLSSSFFIFYFLCFNLHYGFIPSFRSPLMLHFMFLSRDRLLLRCLRLLDLRFVIVLPLFLIR